MLKLLSVALPVFALACVAAGLLVPTPFLANALYFAGLAVSVMAIVLHFVGMRTYDPYKGRRHSAD